jgi:hypothetical protein
VNRSAFAFTATVLLALVPAGCTEDTPTSTPAIGPPQTVGVYFDALARRTTIAVEVGQEFSLYVIAFDLDGGLRRSCFALGELTPAEFAAIFEVLETRAYPPGTASDTMPEIVNFFDLDHGACNPSGGAVVLLRLRVRLLQPVQDLHLFVQPNPIWPNVDCPASPTYTPCSVRTACMDAAYVGGAVINPTR